MTWTPISNPPAARCYVELKLADGTEAKGFYCCPGWVAYTDNASSPKYWRRGVADA